MSTGFIGIDYSITSPGVCIMHADGSFDLHGLAPEETLDGKKPIVGQYDKALLHPFRTNKNQNRILRFLDLAKYILEIIKPYSSYQVAIEGYSMGSAVGNVLDLAENGAVLRLQLLESGFNYVEIAPTSLKKFATGSGRAKKPDMLAAMQAKGFDVWKMIYGDKPITKNIKKPVTDLVDAYWLASWLYEKHLVEKNIK